jgi:peptide/nickel transport system substrate-binding protein
MRVWILLAALLAGPVAVADQKGDCGTIVFPTGAGQAGADDLTSFSPLYSDSAYNAEASWLLYPNLLWINRFSQIDWSRSLASSVTTTDNMTFTITMRPWHWSDGAPVVAGDVAYFFALAKQLGTDWPGYGGGGLPDIVKSVDVLSATQLRITTIHPVNPTWFIYNAISALAPLPEHAWKKYTLDQMYQLQSSPGFYDVVDGPLKLERLDMGLDAVFVPNPAWDGPKMHFSRMVFRFLQGDGAQVQGVESGDLDEGQLPPDLYASVRHIAGVHVEVLPQQLYQDTLILNYRNPKVAFFRDYRVREAMEDAIDQQAIVNGLQHGAGDVSLGPVIHSMVRFLTPAMRAGVYPVGYDPAKAHELLTEAGFTPGPDGIMQKDGQRLSFTYFEQSGTDYITELDEIIQADLRKAGIEMKIQQMEFNQMMAVMSSRPADWEAGGAGQPDLFYPTGEGEYASTAFQNFGGYSDPVMDRLIDESVNEPGLDGLFAYETYASAQLPVIFTARQRPVILVNNRLHGMNEFIDPIGMYAPDQLYCTAGAGVEK